MNRSLGYFGLGLVVVGISMVASPIVLTGKETMTLVSLAGLLVAPVGLTVIGIAAASFDPRRTTVHGGIGGDDTPIPARRAHPAIPETPRLSNLRAPVRCANCRAIITYELARCPRCAEDRPCRACGRPLTAIDDVASCPGCSRQELFCNCSHTTLPPRRSGVGRAPRGR